MVWFNVDDTLAFHQKTILAGNAALGLWTRAGSWCCSTLTDGFVPTAIARSLGTIGQCKALVNAGLWIEVEGGYEFHEWQQRQQTKADVEAKREADRLRKADQRRRKNVPPGLTEESRADSSLDSPADSPLDSGAESLRESHPESAEESAPPSPSLPFPSVPEGTDQKTCPPAAPSDGSSTAVVASPPRSTRHRRNGDDPPGFAAFWEIYPRKESRKAAVAAFVKAMKIADLETILSGVKNYIEATRDRDPRRVAHGSTWLNQERWNDEPLPAWHEAARGQSGESAAQSIKEMGAELALEAEFQEDS